MKLHLSLMVLGMLTNAALSFGTVRCETKCAVQYYKILDTRYQSEVSSSDFHDNCRWLGGYTYDSCQPTSGIIQYDHYWCIKAEKPVSTGYGYGVDLIEARQEARKSCNSGLPDLRVIDCKNIYSTRNNYEEVTMECH